MSNQKEKATLVEDDDDDEAKRKRRDNSGLCCPICMEPWTSQGLHQVCCLPCGHVYGMSCISRWIQQCGKRSKCPQCNAPCRQKDVRKIYASPVYIADADLQKVNKTKHASVGEAEVESVDSTSRLDSLRRMDTTAKLETVRRVNPGMLSFMHVLMAVLSLLICVAVYISLRHSIWMFLVTILMFLVAISMFLVDELIS